MRLFYAIGLWRLLDLSHLRDSLRDVTQLRWVTSDRVHITLRFLGEVEPGALQELAGKLRDVAGKHEPFVLRWGRVGSFPRNGLPRVLWVGLDELSEEQVVNISRDLGNDQPTPHVTVARVRGVLPRQVAKQWETVECGWPQVPVNQIELVESKLTPAGPIYRTIAAEKLKAKS